MDGHINPATWNRTILAAGGSFLQSYEWGEFQQAYGRPVDRWQMDQLALQTIVHILPAGRTFLFTPYGPSGTFTPSTINQSLDHIQILAKKYQAIFWRYERGGEQYGGVSVPAVHPVTTWLTPLHEPTAMLAAMKPKWRYNIRLAQRKGVAIRHTTALTDVAVFYALLQQTAQRQRIHLHPKSYYQLMLDHLGRAGCAQLYFAEFAGQTVAAALVIRFGTTVTYLHGGSEYGQRQLMAPHLLQWRIMTDAQPAGYTVYDWFGIVDNDRPDHPWATLTRFKQGCGGASQRYAGTFELPLQRTWYNAYRLIKRSRVWTSS